MSGLVEAPHDAATTWHAARYAVKGRRVPPLTQALLLAERVHQSLVSLAKDTNSVSVFTGLDVHGVPLRGNQHAYVFAESHGHPEGDITHVCVCSRMPFGPSGERALEQLRQVWGVGEHALDLLMIACGTASELGGMNARAGRCPALTSACSVWGSRTPFVPTRHPKQNRAGVARRDETGLQIGGPEHDLRRLIAESRLPVPLAVRELDYATINCESVPWTAFRTVRTTGGGRRGAGGICGFEVTFPTPVAGPINVGYGAHFGLGLFEPVTSDHAACDPSAL